MYFYVVCFSYFPEIFNASGVPPLVAKYGDWFSYEHSPRAEIFRRDHRKVTNEDSMMKLMRQTIAFSTIFFFEFHSCGKHCDLA